MRGLSSILSLFRNEFNKFNNIYWKRELVALFNLSPWCLVMVEWLFLAVPWGCLQFEIVLFPDHTHLLFLSTNVRFYLSHDIKITLKSHFCLKNL